MYELDMSIQQSEDNVMEAVLQCLDKADMMLEYAGYDNEMVDEYVAELFDMFMESTARRKKADEIDEYMRKHNIGDVNSKNPSKAKEARSMRNFLIMHDFNPSNGTIKSSDGKRRIWLTPNAEESFHRGNSFGGYDEISLEKDIKKFHQADKQFTINHEKGHEHFAHDGSSAKWRSQLDENERGIKHIKAAKEAGKKISSHDDGSYLTKGAHDSPEELEADLHSVKNTHIRTKYAGRKRAVKRSGATRDINDNEIEKVFATLDKLAFKPSMYQSEINNYRDMCSCLSKLRDSYSSVCKKLRSGQATLTNCEGVSTLMITIDNFSLYLDISKHSRISDIINDYYRSLNIIDEILDEIKRIKSKTELSELDERTLSNINYSLEEYRKNVNYIKEHHKDIDKSGGARIIKIRHDVSHLSSILKHDEKKYNELLTKFLNEETDNTKLMDELIDMLTKLTDPERVRKDFKDALKQWKKDMTKHTIRDTAQMRHDFVKKYVHECFEEFMSEYYSYENVFGDYMED